MYEIQQNLHMKGNYFYLALLPLTQQKLTVIKWHMPTSLIFIRCLPKHLIVKHLTIVFLNDTKSHSLKFENENFAVTV